MKSLKLFLMRELRCSGVLQQGLRAGLTEPSLFGAYKEHSVHLSGVDEWPRNDESPTQQTYKMASPETGQTEQVYRDNQSQA